MKIEHNKGESAYPLAAEELETGKTYVCAEYPNKVFIADDEGGSIDLSSGIRWEPAACSRFRAVNAKVVIE